jgi:hypothetical protein
LQYIRKNESNTLKKTQPAKDVGFGGHLTFITRQAGRESGSTMKQTSWPCAETATTISTATQKKALKKGGWKKELQNKPLNVSPTPNNFLI